MLQVSHGSDNGRREGRDEERERKIMRGKRREGEMMEGKGGKWREREREERER